MSIKVIDGTIVKEVESVDSYTVTSASIEAQIKAKEGVITKLQEQIKEAKADLVEAKKLEKKTK